MECEIGGHGSLRQHELSRRTLLSGAVALAAPGPLASAGNWYEKSFYLLHLDHHTSERSPVGQDADPGQTARLLALSRPDVIQIHAKGRPGWTTYPSKIGHTPPKLARDVLRVWTDISRRDDYRFSAYYNIGRDGEIMKRRPEWNRVRADGTPYDTSLCYHSGVAENYLWPMIDEVLRTYRPDGFWFDGSCFTVSVCYCAKCTDRFRREYGKEVPKKPAQVGWAEFKEMQRRIYRDFIRETGARVKRSNPACLVAVNWAYSLIMPDGVDDSVDYLSGDRATDVDGLSLDAHWYDGQGKPFDLMTTVFVGDSSGRGTLKPVEQMEQELAIIVANGGRYFAWDNPTPGSGLAPERQEYLGRVVAPWLRARQPWCQRTVRVPDVSLLNSATDHYAATLSALVVFARDRKRGLERSEPLCREHLNYEMISSQRLERGDIRSRVLIVDDPQALSPGEKEALRRFVSGGGVLLLTGVRFNEEFVKGRLGKGEVVRTVVALNAFSPEEAGALWKTILPPERRLVSATAPVTVEVVLRRRESDYILHLVNRAPGKREIFPDVKPGGPQTRITDIPRVTDCHVSLRLPAKPRAVVSQPHGQPLRNWTWRDGRVEMDVPEFHIHQIVVATLNG